MQDPIFMKIIKTWVHSRLNVEHYLAPSAPSSSKEQVSSKLAGPEQPSLTACATLQQERTSVPFKDHTGPFSRSIKKALQKFNASHEFEGSNKSVLSPLRLWAIYTSFSMQELANWVLIMPFTCTRRTVRTQISMPHMIGRVDIHSTASAELSMHHCPWHRCCHRQRSYYGYPFDGDAKERSAMLVTMSVW